jgi:Leucine-rich repeat (LRR) protein
MSVEEYLLLATSDSIRLDLSNKNLKKLPDLSRFTKLTILDCSHNELTSLPSTKGFFPDSLQSLYCDNNNLISLPSTLGSLNSLKYLYCGNNKLTSLPNNLPHSLRYLFCENNELTSLPDNLPILVQLNCSYNCLTSLPSKLRDLEILNCSNNNLTHLPDTLPDTLEQLNCSYNNLTYLPDTLPNTLEQLNCSYNQLTSLPSTEGCLPNSLKEFNCSNNKFSIYPYLLERYTYVHGFDDEYYSMSYIISYVQEMNKLNGIQKCREWLNIVNKNNVFLEIYERKIMNPVNFNLLLQNNNMDIDLFIENYTSLK